MGVGAGVDAAGGNGVGVGDSTSVAVGVSVAVCVGVGIGVGLLIGSLPPPQATNSTISAGSSSSIDFSFVSSLRWNRNSL